MEETDLAICFPVFRLSPLIRLLVVARMVWKYCGKPLSYLLGLFLCGFILAMCAWPLGDKFKLKLKKNVVPE